MRYWLAVVMVLTSCLCYGVEYKKYIQIRFSEKTDYGTYNDALYFTPEEFDKVEQDTIDKAMRDRVDNWVSIVSNPPEPIEPTKDELEKYKSELESQLSVVQTKISALTVVEK